jgi:hypothetical protein
VIDAYLILADRIQQEFKELTHVISRAGCAIRAARQHPDDLDLYIDSAALNLHDFYGFLERIFQQIGTAVDGDLLTGSDWHKQLLLLMQLDIPDLRPPVLSTETVIALDKYRRFRHVVRNIYAFQFNPQQIERLVNQMPTVFTRAQSELLVFIDFLRQVGAS